MPLLVDVVVAKLIEAIDDERIPLRTRFNDEDIDVKRRAWESLGNTTLGHLSEWTEYYATEPWVDIIARRPYLHAPNRQRKAEES